jgi:hypothetical protein
MAWLCGCLSKGPVVDARLFRIKATAESLGVDFGSICQLESSVETINVKAESDILHDLLKFASEAQETGHFSVRFASVSVVMDVLLSGHLAVGVHYALISELGRRLQPQISQLLSDASKGELVKVHVASWLEKITDVHSDTPWQKVRQDLGSIRSASRANTRIAPDWATLLVKSFNYFWHANQKETFTVLVFSIVRVLLRQGTLVPAVTDLMEHFAITIEASETAALWHHFCRAVFHTLGSEICADMGNSLFSLVDEAGGKFGVALRKPPADSSEDIAGSVNKYLTTAIARALHRALIVYASDTGVRLLQLLVKEASDGEFKRHVYAALVSVSLDKHPKLKAHLWRRRMVDSVLLANPQIDEITNSILAQPEDSQVLATVAAMTNRGSVLRIMDAETVISGCAKFRLPVDRLDVVEDDTAESRELARERMVLAELREVKEVLLSEISAGNQLLHEFRKIRELQMRQAALPSTEADEVSQENLRFVSPPRRASALVSRAVVGPDDRLRRSIDAMNAAFLTQKFVR